jgi:pimeloyl-ACP methyl ester carboxylesterase
LNRKFFTRATLIPLALVGLGGVLWMGAATFITYHLLHPPFLDGGRGDVFIASGNVPLGDDPKSYCDAPFEDVRITDADGITVDGWFVPGTLPSAVLLIPASGASKRALLPYVKILHNVGLPLLAIDSSDFVRGRDGWGWGQRASVRSVAATLRKKGFANIAALGVSEGAAAALMIQAEAPDTFNAIVADSSFTTLGAMLRRYPSLAGLNPAFLETTMWELGLALGHNVEDISPIVSASKLGHCALLVIQNDKDPLTPESDGRKILAADPDSRRGIYLARSEGHGDAIYADPAAYEKKVREFLAPSLPGAIGIAPR